MGKALLSIEAGTGALKVCVFSTAGEVLAKSQRTVQLTTPKPAWAEVDVEHYWQLIVSTTREAAAGFDIVGIGVSATCPTTIFMDAEFKPIRPAILYLDRRSDEYVKEFAEKNGGGQTLFRRMGNHPFSSTCWLGNIPWIRNQEGGFWKKTRHVGLLSSFIIKRLTGAFVLDWTQASYSGGFNIYKPEQGWMADMLRAWGVDEKILPALGWSGGLAGKLKPAPAAELGLCSGVAVALGAADTVAAAFALGLRDARDVLETAGTSGVMTFCMDRPDFDEAFMNRCHIFPNQWLAHGAMSTLGGAFAWIKNKVWPEVASFAELEQIAAESPAGANGLVFLPYLAGERSPIWDPDASGVWAGLRLDSTRADMVRAVFEGAAYGLRQILERAKGRWELQPRRVMSVGGPRSRFWTKVKREITGLDYLLAEKPDAVSWGSALLGGIAAGVFSGLDDPLINFIPVIPSSTAASRSEHMRLNDLERKRAYDKAFQAYEALYPALKPIMRDLSHN